jgi:hypothetical protein
MPVPVDYTLLTYVFKVNTSPKEMTTSIAVLDISVGGPRSVLDMATDGYTAMHDTNAPGAAGHMIDEYSLESCVAAFGTSTGDLVAQFVSHTQGTVSDSPITSNCALLVRKNTALGGRRNRGRFFAPPSLLNEGAVDPSGNISSGPLASLQTLWTNFFNLLATADLEPQLFHQGSSPPAPTPVTSFTVDSLIATQRRRMRS